MKPAKAISFDLDGTLLDGSHWREVVMGTCDEVGPALGLKGARLARANREVWGNYFPSVERQWALGAIEGRAVTTNAWRQTLAVCGVDDEWATQLVVETYLRNRRAALRLFDDVRPTLEGLRPRFPLALITNGATDTQRDALRALDIASEFLVIAISAEIGFAKPDPALFGVVLKTFQIAAGSAWHVGNNLGTDVAGAKSAGWVAVWLNRQGEARGTDDPEPDYEIRSLLELPALLPASSG
jgi:HAD superfamily hydrolase (TIGR01549 family)